VRTYVFLAAAANLRLRISRIGGEKVEGADSAEVNVSRCLCLRCGARAFYGFSLVAGSKINLKTEENRQVMGLFF
jgi:hypothetical protein